MEDKTRKKKKYFNIFFHYIMTIDTTTLSRYEMKMKMKLSVTV